MIKESGKAGEHGSHPSHLTIRSIELTNFKFFEHIAVELGTGSKLGGQWTCIAGINGAGKSTLLQGICLVLLGERLARDLGSSRLDRMRRLHDGKRSDATLAATVIVDDQPVKLALRIDESGVQAGAEGMSSSELDAMYEFWKLRLVSHVLVSYGATRNLSDYFDTRHQHIHPEVRSQMTLFDPLSQVASAERIADRVGDPRLATLMVVLIEEALGADLGPSVGEQDRLAFQVGEEIVAVVDLPDGYRSCVAWLADLVATWWAKNGSDHPNPRPEHIHGVVLVDELDLHLHPSLQRQLVPRLRAALPNVQFIATTHSPLVLSSFAAEELVALDRSEPGGVRVLDRDILGFTTDEVYEWLMDTEPTSAALQAQIESGALPRNEIAKILGMSKDVAEAEAERRVARATEFLTQFKK